MLTFNVDIDGATDDDDVFAMRYAVYQENLRRDQTGDPALPDDDANLRDSYEIVLGTRTIPHAHRTFGSNANARIRQLVFQIAAAFETADASTRDQVKSLLGVD